METKKCYTYMHSKLQSSNTETEHAADIQNLNQCVHSQIKHWLSRNESSDINDMSIDNWISETDPQLWNMICSLTTSVSEKRGTSRVSDINSPAYHTKKI